MIIKEQEIISSYKKNGYIVVKKLMPYELIEEALKIYTRLVSQKPLIYTQSTHKWEEIKLDNEEAKKAAKAATSVKKDIKKINTEGLMAKPKKQEIE